MACFYLLVCMIINYNLLSNISSFSFFAQLSQATTKTKNQRRIQALKLQQNIPQRKKREKKMKDKIWCYVSEEDRRIFQWFSFNGFFFYITIII